jgi:hypothetical protein
LERPSCLTWSVDGWPALVVRATAGTRIPTELHCAATGRPPCARTTKPQPYRANLDKGMLCNRTQRPRTHIRYRSYIILLYYLFYLLHYIILFYIIIYFILERLCGLVVRVPGYRSRGPGFDPRPYQIFWEVVGVERGLLSLVSTIEELLGRKSSGSCLENGYYSRGDPSCWPSDTLYPQKLVPTKSTSGGRSVGIVSLWTQATEFFFYIILLQQNCMEEGWSDRRWEKKAGRGEL